MTVAACITNVTARCGLLLQMSVHIAFPLSSLSVSVCISVLIMTVIPAKMAEPIEMLFAGRLRWAQGTMQCIRWGVYGHTWQIRLNDVYSVVMWAVIAITVTTFVFWLVVSNGGANYSGTGGTGLPCPGCESNTVERSHGTVQTEAAAASGQCI